MSTLKGSWPQRRALLGLGMVAAVASALLVPYSASAATPGSWSTAQPGASGTGCAGVRATVALDAGGKLRLSATSDCNAALEPAQLGLTTSATSYTTGLEFVSRTDSTITDNYTTVTGKELARNRAATLTTLNFDKAGNRFTVILRTSSSGVAFRYELGTAGSITDDATEYAFPGETKATTSPFTDAHEGLWSNTALSTLPAGAYDFGVLLRRTNGVNVLLAESDVTGAYAGGKLNKYGTGFELQLATASIAVPAGFKTPWRTAAIGTAASVFESTLTDDVARPSQVADTSWIRPGVSAWSWLDGGEATGASLAAQKGWVDYASSQGWAYSLVDGGWKGQTWMPELVQYAAERGVGIFVWYHWSDLDTVGERDTVLTQLNNWGVKGAKIDFMNSDSQAQYQWYDAILAATAAHQIMVDFHGARLPQGVYRTWPHVLTQEGIRGSEYYGGSRNNAHVTALPFSRGVLGGSDYTPFGFQTGKPNSDAVELALTVQLDSGLLCPAATREVFAARPVAQWWSRQIPVVWDETKLVGGDPETGAIVARRSGTNWYLGASKAGAAAAAISYSTSFLGSGTWHAEIINDTASGGLVRTSQTITAGATLSIASVVTNGGHVVRFTRDVTPPAGYTRLRIDSTDQVLNVAGASTANGAAIVQWYAGTDPNSLFQLQSVGDGFYRIVAQHSGRAVVIDSGSTSAGAVAKQWNYDAGAVQNDEWLLEDASSGRFRLLNRGSGLYLTQPGAAAGTQFQQRPATGADNQLFWFD